MIKPATLWALFKQCDDSQWLGTICRALGGQNVELDFGQRQLLSVIKADSGWMDERIEAQREKWRHQKRGQRGQFETTADIADIADKSTVRECPPPSVRSVHPSVHPSNQEYKNRSVNVPLADNQNGTERNANGTGSEILIPAGKSESHRLAAMFADEVNRNGTDGDSVFFDGRYDAVTICLAITGDFKSARRWRQIVNAKGEAAVREEAFAFWRELQSGEDADNRGAALNARLGRLADI